MGATSTRAAAGTQDTLAGAVRRDPVLRGLLAFGVVMWVLLLAMPGRGSLLLTYWGAQPLLDVATVLLIRRILRVPELGRANSRFWRVLQYAVLLFTSADLMQFGL